MREYTLIVKGKRIPVTYEVYKTYYQEYEHERYLKNKAAKNEHSLEQFIEAGVSIELLCVDSLTPVEYEVLKAEQLQISASAVGHKKQKILKALLQEMKTEYK